MAYTVLIRHKWWRVCQHLPVDDHCGTKLEELSAMPYIPPPSQPPFNGLKPAPPKTGFNGKGKLRKRWIDASGNIYEWDYQHGRFEKYDSKGKHLGEFALDGTQTKPTDPTRSVKP